jgi:hypothetical protein
MPGPPNPVFIYLLEHPFFFGERIQRIIQARNENQARPCKYGA